MLREELLTGAVSRRACIIMYIVKKPSIFLDIARILQYLLLRSPLQCLHGNDPVTLRWVNSEPK